MCDHGRQLRGHRDQEGFFAFVEAAPLGLLNHQHAEHIALVNDGCAEEGVEGFLAQALQQLEAGMALGVLEVDRLLALGHQADQAFTRRQARRSHLQRVQTLGSAKHEAPAGFVAHVHAADLSAHGIAYALDDDLQRIIESFGCIHLLHDIAQGLQHHGRHQPGTSVSRASGGANSLRARRYTSRLKATT